MTWHKIFQIGILLFLLTSCSNDDTITPNNSVGKESVQSLPISIALQTRANSGNTEIDGMYDGIDKVRILAFRCEKEAFEQNAKNATFTYVQGCISPDEIVDCTLESGSSMRTAKATFKPLENDGTAYVYRLYAIAYNSTRFAEGVTLDVEDKNLYYAADEINGDIEGSNFAYITVN